MPLKHSAARRHRIPQIRCQVQNWRAFETGLTRRSDLTTWPDNAALNRWQAPRRITPRLSLVLGCGDGVDAAVRLPSYPAPSGKLHHECASAARAGVTCARRHDAHPPQPQLCQAAAQDYPAECQRCRGRRTPRREASAIATSFLNRSLPIQESTCVGSMPKKTAPLQVPSVLWEETTNRED